MNLWKVLNADKFGKRLSLDIAPILIGIAGPQLFQGLHQNGKIQRYDLKGYYSVNSNGKCIKSWPTCNVQQWDQPLRCGLAWCLHPQGYWEQSWDHQVHHDQASLCSETDIYCVVRLLPVEVRRKTLKKCNRSFASKTPPFPRNSDMLATNCLFFDCWNSVVNLPGSCTGAPL